ncbi:K(+)-transporting ATPase subunit C [Nocardiopsis changdeensis]|uniref:Potassium-transporting ATPase KdpC subunit n=1 Tax=Nocardiopsis changdeensis TaxID=2831969 RepID=A0ABX8BEP7_9ACTN|nr:MULTISPECIES: K(+)-transporting ATPase subunit C [Nocardiopsis]QUX20502.1 K(+)-transporting ATPase subunit C [Nocardiopsis changdeensis]QYX36433.1 K(+)-transporting ATPase subunit C [Nocardiopsis sp. MT53]
MLRQLIAGFTMMAVATIVLGLAYPLAVTGIAQAAFPHRANGSFVEHDGRTVGSEWISQEFTGPEYFHPRPSAVGHDPRDSGGANLGPTDAGLLDEVAARTEAYRDLNGLEPDAGVPVDAVTASASGLDPHISVENARLQADRVARARGLDAARVEALIGEHTTRRTLGVLGEPGVNVLELNLALDRAPA